MNVVIVLTLVFLAVVLLAGVSRRKRGRTILKEVPDDGSSQSTSTAPSRTGMGSEDTRKPIGSEAQPSEQASNDKPTVQEQEVPVETQEPEPPTSEFKEEMPTEPRGTAETSRPVSPTEEPVVEKAETVLEQGVGPVRVGPKEPASLDAKEDSARRH